MEFTFRNQEWGRTGWGARGRGSTDPTWLVSSRHKADRIISHVLTSQAGLGAIPRFSCPQWRCERVSFFSILASGWGLRGRKRSPFYPWGGREARGTMTADGCVTLGGHWCCLRTWTEGSCSSCTGNIWARLFGLETQRKSVLHFNSSSFHSQACPSKALMEGSSLGPCEFPWEWLLCPLLQKGEAVHWFHFLALPQPGSRMTWPTDNLDAWKPKTSTLFFLCVYVPFLHAVEANKRRSFARIACLLGRLKKGKSDSRV